MTEVRCTSCGAENKLRSQFEVDGECPDCGEECLEVLDPYDDPDIRSLRCAECGFEVDAGVEVGWDKGRSGIFTIDDDCPMCAEAGEPGQALEPADVPLREPPDYKSARAAASRLRGDAPVPINVEGLADTLGLTVRRGPFLHDGLLTGDVIEVPENSPPAVERFLIAHEIGHRVLGHQGDRHKIEPEANAFASELLVPAALLRRELATPQSPSALARQFAVSRQVIFNAVRSARMTNRLAR